MVCYKERWCVWQLCEREGVTKLCERCAKKAQCTVLRPTKLNVLSWDQQDPAPPFCTKQMKDITVLCNRLSCSLHTHVSIAVTKLRKQFFTGRVKPFLRQWHMNDSFANYQIIHEAILRSTRECHKHCHQNSEHDNRNETSHIASTHALKVVNNIVAVCCSFISKQKRLDNTARPKLLRTPCWRRYFSQQQMVLHTLRQTIWCTILKDMYNYISSRNISCPQGISMTVMRTASLHRAWHPAGVWQQCERHTVPRKWSTKTWTKHRTTLTAKNVVYQKLKRLACTLPVGSSILGQRLTAKKNHQKPTVSEVLTNTLCKTSSHGRDDHEGWE